MRNPAEHIYLGIEDAIDALECGDIEEALESLEAAKEYIEPFISLFTKAELSTMARDEIYQHLGINIPRKYTLAQALSVIEELHGNN